MSEDESRIERTTISLTAYQMREMKKRLDHGMFPDMTEGIRVAVMEYIEHHPNNPAISPAPEEHGKPEETSVSHQECAPVVTAS
jgi:Arc/MetJ-type ribon-helix-helix transcriptional regulator